MNNSILLTRVMLVIIAMTFSLLVGSSVAYGFDGKLVTEHGYSINEEIPCLALATYHEAANQNPYGQLWVMNVIRNRTIDPRWPDSYCDVVYQPKQFSGFNSRNYLVSSKIYSSLYEVAEGFVLMKSQDITFDATHYFNPDIANPKNHEWIRDCLAGKKWGKLEVRAKVGDHVFCGPLLKPFHE